MIGDWFDASMERVSGVYKRKAQTFAFWLGLTVAAAGNLNAIAVGRHLADDPAMRQAVAEGATRALSGKDFDLAKSEDRQKLSESVAEVGLEAGLPIGWRLPPAGKEEGAIAHVVRSVLDKALADAALLGWLVTALASTLGAACWFELLKRFVNIRAAGSKPKE